MAQFVIRLDDDLVAAVDELVDAGIVESRSDAVRRSLRELVDRHRRDQVAAAIVTGYQRRPQAEGETGWSDAATIRMIADEPW